MNISRLGLGTAALTVLIAYSGMTSFRAQAPAPAQTPQAPAPAAGAGGRGQAAPLPPESLNCVELAAALRTVNANDTRLRDWPQIARYHDANATVATKPDAVFMGDSITDFWPQPRFGAFFPGKNYVGRGISAQTTPQMLIRMRPDVIALKPKVVVILAGTNDIAGNTGPSTLEMIEDNIASMAEIARANGIKVVLSSVLPAFDYRWKPGMEPAPKIVALNKWIRGYADRTNAVYLDYHSAMADERQGLRAELTSDGVHPTEAGYRIMAPLADAAIAEALRR